jgi:type I restriction enzyme S subunit
MAGEWRASTWGEEISLEYGKALRGHDEAQGRYRVFGANGPIGWTSQPLAQGPGVILGRKGAYRGVQYSPEPFFVIDTAYYVAPKSELDMRWLYYAIRHYKLGEVDDGSPIPSTTRAAVYMLDLDVPPPDEQRAIAHILGTLDDKIELNRRMSETLEAMARALFKSWFVDFDPVRAKAEGRDPGLPQLLADLFPDSFEDSELGEIPKGWRVATIRELASDIQYGFTQSASTDQVGPHFLRITDIQGGTVDWGTVPFCEVTPEEHERYRLEPGDVLVARTGASTGENIYLPSAPDAVFASYLVRFQFSDLATARSVGAFMRTQAYFDYVAACLGGSAQPNASAQVLAGAQLVAPTLDIPRMFTDFVMPLDKRIAASNEASGTLAALRDTLLPKLISGKLRVMSGEDYSCGA